MSQIAGTEGRYRLVWRQPSRVDSYRFIWGDDSPTSGEWLPAAVGAEFRLA
jgi:hypothetical protein